MNLNIWKIISILLAFIYLPFKETSLVFQNKDKIKFFWRSVWVTIMISTVSILYLFLSVYPELLQPSFAHAQTSCNQRIETVSLVNIQTDEEIRTLTNGYRIQLDNTNLSHLALVPQIQDVDQDESHLGGDTNGIGIESLYYDLASVLFQTKNLPPYTLEAADILNQAGGYIRAMTLIHSILICKILPVPLSAKSLKMSVTR